MSDKVRQAVVVIGLLGTVVMNGLANALPFNGQTTAMVSDKFKVFFVPAGYVFAIWGVIYLGLLAYAVYQALPAQADNPRLRRIGYLFVFNCIANSLWLLAWHYEQFPLTVILMLTILASLIAIYWMLGTGRSRVPAAETWLVRVPFSIYLGWITVATVANVTDFLSYLRWDGSGIGGESWAVIMLLVAFALGGLMVNRHGDLAYTCVLVWAFAGIAVKQAASPLVSYSAWILAGLLAVLVVAMPLVRRITAKEGAAK